MKIPMGVRIALRTLGVEAEAELARLETVLTTLENFASEIWRIMADLKSQSADNTAAIRRVENKIDYLISLHAGSQPEQSYANDRGNGRGTDEPDRAG
jgi:hypothetical protein